MRRRQIKISGGRGRTSLSLPNVVMEKLSSAAFARGVSQTHIVTEALAKHLGMDAEVVGTGTDAALVVIDPGKLNGIDLLNNNLILASERLSQSASPQLQAALTIVLDALAEGGQKHGDGSQVVYPQSSGDGDGSEAAADKTIKEIAREATEDDGASGRRIPKAGGDLPGKSRG